MRLTRGQKRFFGCLIIVSAAVFMCQEIVWAEGIFSATQRAATQVKANSGRSTRVRTRSKTGTLGNAVKNMATRVPRNSGGSGNKGTVRDAVNKVIGKNGYNRASRQSQKSGDILVAYPMGMMMPRGWKPKQPKRPRADFFRNNMADSPGVDFSTLPRPKVKLNK